jgi:CcmD family protein
MDHFAESKIEKSGENIRRTKLIMKAYRYIIMVIVLALMPLIMQAQKVDMADEFRKEGKIYVVVAVAVVILAGIFTYLFLLDRKVSRIEKQIKRPTFK